MIRPVPLRRYLDVMQQRGFSSDDVLRDSGMTEHSVDDPQAVVDLRAYLQVIDNILELSGDSGIGLDMGLAREVGDFRVLGHAAMASQNVRQAIHDFWFRYGDTMGMMAKIGLPRRTGATCVGDLIATDVSEPTYRFFIEEALAVLMNVGTQVNGSAPVLEGLNLSYREPVYSHRYRALFGCQIRFEAGSSQVVLSQAWLEAPLKTQDPELLQLFQESLEKTKRDIETSQSAGSRLRQLFFRSGHTLPPLDEAAGLLGLSSRTLRRRLLDEGLSYRGLAEDYRIQIALEHLRRGTPNTKTLGAKVGFADVNAFRRAFKRWTGQTVSGFVARGSST